MSSQSITQLSQILNISDNCSLGDIVRVALVPGHFFTYHFKNHTVDTSSMVYDEVNKTWKKTPHPVGKIIETFKNKKDGNIWVGIYCRADGLIYNTPMFNIIEKLF